MKDVLAYIMIIAVIGLIVAGAFFAMFGIRINASEGNVSGVVYNTTNDAFISGNTSFSVRASEDTYVSEENRSSFCLPPDSEYIGLVNEAAADKDIRVNVKTDKVFTWVLPWQCVDNVTVERL